MTFLSQKVKAMYDFEPQDDNELELRAGDIVEVLDNSDHDCSQHQQDQDRGFQT